MLTDCICAASETDTTAWMKIGDRVSGVHWALKLVLKNTPGFVLERNLVIKKQGKNQIN